MATVDRVCPKCFLHVGVQEASKDAKRCLLCKRPYNKEDKYSHSVPKKKGSKKN